MVSFMPVLVVAPTLYFAICFRSYLTCIVFPFLFFSLSAFVQFSGLALYVILRPLFQIKFDNITRIYPPAYDRIQMWTLGKN